MATNTKEILPGFHQIALGMVNAFLIESDDGLALIDTGYPGNGAKILEAVGSLGKAPKDLRHILVTHCHPDHAGSLAELVRQTGATVWMHPTDAEMVRSGRCLRPVKTAPGFMNAIIGRMIRWTASHEIEPAEVAREVTDGESIPVGGGLRAIHVPGHCAGQLAFLWPKHGGVLIAADVAANIFGLGLSPVYEDLDEGRRSLAKLSTLDFQAAVFGHGGPILKGASDQFRAKWPRPADTPAPVS